MSTVDLVSATEPRHGTPTAQRRAEIMDAVKRRSWFVMRTRGMTKHLATLYGVDRTQIENDFAIIGRECAVADIGQIEMDTRNLFGAAMARAAELAQDPKLSASERARFNQQVIMGAPRQAQILEAFGKKDRDMAPPPQKEERADDKALDQMARDFAAGWKAKNRPPKPEGL